MFLRQGCKYDRILDDRLILHRCFPRSTENTRSEFKWSACCKGWWVLLRTCWHCVSVVNLASSRLCIVFRRSLQTRIRCHIPWICSILSFPLGTSKEVLRPLPLETYKLQVKAEELGTKDCAAFLLLVFMFSHCYCNMVKYELLYFLLSPWWFVLFVFWFIISVSFTSARCCDMPRSTRNSSCRTETCRWTGQECGSSIVAQAQNSHYRTVLSTRWSCHRHSTLPPSRWDYNVRYIVRQWIVSQ